MKNEIQQEQGTQSHKGEALQNQAQQDFLDYISTLQILKLRLKGIDEGDFVFINFKEVIERRFFKYPTYSARKNIEHMLKVGAIDVWVTKSPKSGYTMSLYKGLRPGAFRPELVTSDARNLGYVSRKMRETLKHVSIKSGTITNSYFEHFLQHKERYTELFFKKDDFSGRVHTPITSLPAQSRQCLFIDGESTQSIDVATMQPLILGLILKKEIGNNPFSSWIDNGDDVYLKLSETLNLGDREKGKKRFFEIIFAPASDELAKIFGNAHWIGWINSYKRKIVPGNKNTNRKRYSNMAWLLQKTEVEIMQCLWKKLYENNILFLSVHDEIIVKKSDLKQSLDLFKNVMDSNFPYYKLNTK